MISLRKIVVIAAAFLFACSWSSDSAAEEGAAEKQRTDVIVLRSRKFDFPLATESKSSAKKVRLYVSNDSGKTWRIAVEEPISAPRLTFEGTEDGEHWFAISTDEREIDTQDLRAQRKVLIDTIGPEIRLDASANTQGHLHGTLQLIDPNAVASLRVLYATDVQREWKTIANRSIDTEGNFQVRLSEAWRKLTLHVTATDSLGNASVEAKTVERPRFASSPRGAAKAEFATHAQREAENGMSTQLVDGPSNPGNLFLGMRTGESRSQPNEAAELELPAQGVPAKITPNGIELIPTPTPNQSESTSEELPAPRNSEPSEPPKTNGQPESATPENSSPTDASERDSTDERPSDKGTSPSAPKRSRSLSEAMRPIDPEGVGQVRVNPFNGSVPPAPTETRDRKSFDENRRHRVERATEENRARQEQFDRAQLALIAPIRYSDTNRFSLEYALEAVGSSGVEAVELYGTLDGGRTWTRWGADPDRKSPFDIETKGEGVFGFRVVVLGNNGLASARPLAGDPPDIAVIVDQTDPKIRITSARYGEGNRTGSLEIRYECEDAYLMKRPVTIAFSDSVDGPWTTIAAGLRNDGLYVWPADPKLPRKIYLRLDATDQSGNRGTYVLDQAIETQGLAPRAKILGLR